MGKKKRVWLGDRSESPERTPAGNSQKYRALEFEEGLKLGELKGPRRPPKDISDYVSIHDGSHSVDICHAKCSGKLIGILSYAWDLPQDHWSTRSLKTHQTGGVPIKHDLHCLVCKEFNDDEIGIY